MSASEESHLFDEGLIARRRIQKWAAVSVGVLLVLRIVAELSPVMRRPDLVLLDAWQSLRGTRTPSPQVVVVGIDEKSIRKIGPPPWPRSEYAPLVDRLAHAGARVIGFDITFGALEREVANSQLLAESMQKAGNVVFGYEFTRVGDASPPGTPPSEVMQKNALPRYESVAIPPAPSLIEPEPVLAEAAAALGHVRSVASDDGRIRVVPLVIEHGQKAYPSLGLQVARLYTGTPMKDVGLRGGVLQMGEWEIPVSDSGEVLLNWPAGGESAFPQFSFLDVVRGDIPDEAFRDKAVLVGGTADGLDDRDLPFAVAAPGVLIYATFLDNVFRFDFVQAPTWAWLLEWTLFAALCGLGVWVLPRLPTPMLLAGVPVLLLLVVGGAGFLFVQKGIWLKVVYPGLALVVPLGLVVVLRLTASERETRDVTAKEREDRKLLGLSFQEKGMLDMALATFSKLPFTADMKMVYVNLGLDFENRGQVDKAYLVYKRVFEADPGFEGVSRRMDRLIQGGAGTNAFTTPLSTTAPQGLVQTAPHDVEIPGGPSFSDEPTGALPRTSAGMAGGFEGPTSQMPPTVVNPASASSLTPVDLQAPPDQMAPTLVVDSVTAGPGTPLDPVAPTADLSPTLVDAAGAHTPVSLAGRPGHTPAPGAATAAGPPMPDSLDAPTGHLPPPTKPGTAAAPPRPAPASLASSASGRMPHTGAGTGGATGGTAPSVPVLPRTRFGRYEVERHLGRGGMGDVYLVRDTIINRKAALKTIRLDTNLDAQHVIEMRQRFYREGQTAGQLTHPNIVTVYDVAEDLGMAYIVMEFVEGQTLSQVMKKQRLSVQQIKHVLYHACIGLDHAHQQGIFHRDVKPDNFMITKAGVVKVMDFGIARIRESDLTQTGSVMGTPAYMSPEQVNGQKIDARSDIFSLGVILYELLTGRKPFTGESVSSLMFAIIQGTPAQPSTVDGKIHTTWDEILKKALAKDREARYPTAREFAQAIKDVPVR